MIVTITQTVSPKCYCKYENTMCEFANDMGFCVKTGCSKRITINEKPFVNKNLVEVVRCKDCKNWDTTWQNDWAKNYHYCPLIDGTRNGDWYCADGERRSE